MKERHRLEKTNLGVGIILKLILEEKKKAHKLD
jgi:hypothetical protein